MNAKPLDLFSFPRTGGIVEDQERIFPGASRSHLATIFALKFSDLLGRFGQKLMKAIGILSAILRSDLPNRTELYESDQTDEINQQIALLRLGNGSQEIRKTGRNFFWNVGSHGFRVLLGCDSKGDFDRKPFYLKRVSS